MVGIGDGALVAREALIEALGRLWRPRPGRSPAVVRAVQSLVRYLRERQAREQPRRPPKSWRRSSGLRLAPAAESACPGSVTELADVTRGSVVDRRSQHARAGSLASARRCQFQSAGGNSAADQAAYPAGPTSPTRRPRGAACRADPRRPSRLDAAATSASGPVRRRARHGAWHRPWQFLSPDTNSSVAACPTRRPAGRRRARGGGLQLAWRPGRSAAAIAAAQRPSAAPVRSATCRCATRIRN